MTYSKRIFEAVGQICRYSWIEPDSWYAITDLGKVVSLKKKNNPLVLTPWLHRDGYERVSLYLPSGKMKAYVHRLVAFAFVPGFFTDAVVNHINGNKRDNSPRNLEWITHSENVKHAHRTGLAAPVHEHMQAKYGDLRY